jgi:Domain of unknown function (DUF4340)
MKKSHLFSLVLVALVVGLAGLYLEISQSSRWNESPPAQTVFPNLPVNEISRIQIRSATANVTLEKKDNRWTVAERDNYPADFSKIQDLIRILWQLKPGQEMQIGPSQLGRLNVLAPGKGGTAGIEIALKGDKDNEIASLIIGKSVDRSDGARGAGTSGRFVYNPAVKDRVYLVSESFFSVDPVTVGQWLDKNFITPGALTEVAQSPWSNNPGWKITRKDAKADWQLEGLQRGETLDKTFTEGLSSFSPTFVDVRPQSESSNETGLNEPFKVTLKTVDGFTYNLLLGKEGPEKARYLELNVSADLPTARTAEPNENANDKKARDEEFDKHIAKLKEQLQTEKQFEKWVYLVPGYSVQPLLKRRDEIVTKPSPSPTPVSTPTPAPAAASAASPTASPAASPSATPLVSPSPMASPAPNTQAVPSPTASISASSASPAASPSP